MNAAPGNGYHGDLRLSAPGAGLSVSTTHGGRWTSLRVDDLELLGSAYGRPRGVVDWGNYPMTPFAGRIRRGVLVWDGARHQLPLLMPPHAIHGVTLDRNWTLLDDDGTGPEGAEATRAAMRCDFDARWPWQGHAEQHLELTADRLTARLEVHAHQDAMPAWIGYHPWFVRDLGVGAPGRLEIDAEGVLPRDDDGMPLPDPAPVPAPPWDDAFVGVRWPAAVVWDGALRLEIGADSPHAVLFDERPEAICLEPQTAPPNAAELGQAAVVTPQSPLSLTMTLHWQRLSARS